MKLAFTDVSVFITYKDAEVIYDTETGYLVYGKDDGTCLAGAFNKETAETVFNLLPKTATLFSVRGEELKNLILKSGKTLSCKCSQFEYYGEKKEAFLEGFSVKKLGITYLPYLLKNYHSDEEYLTLLINKGVMLGAFIGDKIVGFIGEHYRGTMGLLFVEPDFRHNGVAKLLEETKINELLNKNIVPTAHVIEGNTASYNLQKKLNMFENPTPVYWLE